MVSTEVEVAVLLDVGKEVELVLTVVEAPVVVTDGVLLVIEKVLVVVVSVVAVGVPGGIGMGTTAEPALSVEKGTIGEPLGPTTVNGWLG